VYDTQREAENKYRAEPRYHPARDSKITASAILESLNYLGVFVSIDHDTLVRQYKKKEGKFKTAQDRKPPKFKKKKTRKWLSDKNTAEIVKLSHIITASFIAIRTIFHGRKTGIMSEKFWMEYNQTFVQGHDITGHTVDQKEFGKQSCMSQRKKKKKTVSALIEAGRAWPVPPRGRKRRRLVWGSVCWSLCLQWQIFRVRFVFLTEYIENREIQLPSVVIGRVIIIIARFLHYTMHSLFLEFLLL
jgi:hypothetical protein